MVHGIIVLDITVNGQKINNAIHDGDDDGEKLIMMIS